nr:GNAT family protein [Mammaliicoccus sp. Marseille-Q6498]
MDLLVKLAEYQRMETDRLILRPVTLEDTNALYEYASKLENTTHVFPTHNSIEETKKVIARYYMESPLGKYALELKEENKLIGTIDLRVYTDHKKAEIGYVLNLDYSGKGYMTEAANQILSLSFDTMKLNQVYAVHSTINPDSGKLMKRIGMKKIGVMPKNRIHKDKIVDDAYYVITNDEYRALKKETEE